MNINRSLGLGGGEISLCVALLLGKKERHKENAQEISGKMPVINMFLWSLFIPFFWP